MAEGRGSGRFRHSPQAEPDLSEAIAPPCPSPSTLPLPPSARDSWHQITACRVHLGRRPAPGPQLPLPAGRKRSEAFLPHPRGAGGEQPLRCPLCEPVRRGTLRIRGRQGGACAHGFGFPPPVRSSTPEGWLRPPSPARAGMGRTPALPPFHCL